MGRPLNKKYFGNRNIGTTGTGDNKIGGEGIASINWSNYGSWLSSAGGTDYPLSGLALPAPTLPGGVQATWTNYFGASAVTTGAGSVGLVVGETYEYAPIPGLLVTVATSGNNGTNATFTVNTAGSTTTLLTDLTGVNLTLKTGQGWTGVGTFLVDIKLKIVDTVINEKGSGYVGTETFTVTKVNGATGTAPAGTIVLTTDTGGVGSSTNQENAIRAYAYNGSSLVAVDIVRQISGSAQDHGGRYRINDSTTAGTIDDDTNAIQASAIGRLVTSTANERVTANGKTEWEMNIVAIDSDGGTYLVKKLMSRKVVLVPAAVSRLGSSAGSQFASGKEVPWTFNGTSGTKVRAEQPYLEENVNVKIENA